MRKKKPNFFVYLVVFVGLGVVFTTRAKSDENTTPLISADKSVNFWSSLNHMSNVDGVFERKEPIQLSNVLVDSHAPLWPLNPYFSNVLLAKEIKTGMQWKFRLAYQGTAVNLRYAYNDYQFTLRRASRAYRSEPFSQFGIEYYW